MASPPTWKSGSAQTKREDASTPSTWLAARALARWFSSESTAALGRPVVPEVKSSVADSRRGAFAVRSASCTRRSASVKRVFSSATSAPASSAPKTCASVSG